MTLACIDFGVTTPCCNECSEARKTVVYPPAVFDPTKPDLGMGIRGLMCCHHIHNAQRKSRNWWYEKYLRDSNRFTPTEILTALKATKETHYRVYGEIHAAAREREQSKFKRPTVRLITQRTGLKKCPECGSEWNEVICDNCGHQ